jgi:NAD(P)H-hydrate epimerase
MLPVVTPTEMAAIDAAAPESLDELIARAGWATARAALELLTHSSPTLAYGARIAVLVGKGNNGADGRAAVAHLERAGARCRVIPIESLSQPTSVGGHPFDLLIDAAFGTGLSRPFEPELPDLLQQVPLVLAVDCPSGVDGLTGQLRGRPIAADATVTFAAYKPGLLFSPGRAMAGSVTVADIGLDCARARCFLLEAADLTRWPRRLADDHKWKRAVTVVGGSPGMAGAAALSAHGALRAGAGYVRVASPHPGPGPATTNASTWPTEVVGHPVGADWAVEVLADAERFGALVVGPGLEPNPTQVTELLRGSPPVPIVLDAGALGALASTPDHGQAVLTERDLSLPPPILTPHDGEFARLNNGQPPTVDRVASARQLAHRLRAVVVLKGPTTVVADPDGRVALSQAGDARLATAGSGDVLAGILGAGLAGGLDPWTAAAIGVELHGRAAGRGRPIGLTAGDLPDLVADQLSATAESGVHSA